MTASRSRPRTVTAAFWCWVVASIMLIVGGLIAATAPLPIAFRGAGVLTALAGAGMAFLASRAAGGDARMRRAAVTLALTIVVLVALAAIFGVVHLLTLFAVILLVAGAALITRPSAASARDGGADQ